MKRSLLILLALLAAFALACGLWDEEVATVTYQAAVPFEFTIDADELCAECDFDEGEAPEDIEIDPIAITIPITVDDFNVVGNVSMRDIASRMRSIEITSIDYIVAGNTLTFDLPAIDVYVAPTTTTDPEAQGSVFLTTVPVAPASTEVSENAPVRSDARDPASDLFKTLDFNALLRAQPEVAEGQPLPPSGTADAEIIVNIKIVANAIEAVNQ